MSATINGKPVLLNAVYFALLGSTLEIAGQVPVRVTFDKHALAPMLISTLEGDTLQLRTGGLDVAGNLSTELTFTLSGKDYLGVALVDRKLKLEDDIYYQVTLSIWER